MISKISKKINDNNDADVWSHYYGDDNAEVGQNWQFQWGWCFPIKFSLLNDDSAEHDGDGLRQPPDPGSRKLVLPQRGSLGFLILFNNNFLGTQTSFLFGSIDSQKFGVSKTSFYKFIMWWMELTSRVPSSSRTSTQCLCSFDPERPYTLWWCWSSLVPSSLTTRNVAPFSALLGLFPSGLSVRCKCCGIDETLSYVVLMSILQKKL